MNIKDKIRFIFCSFVPVGLEDYVNYFVKDFSDFIYFKWKFHFVDTRKAYSAKQIFSGGRLISEKKLFSMPKFNNKFIYFSALLIIYLFYLLQSVKNLIITRKSGRIVIFMGVNYFCALCGIILKYLGTVDYVIYRVMDFFPLPKKGIYRIANRIFHIIDRIVLKNSDAIWFTTIGHIEGREEYGYFDRKKYFYEIIPLGIEQNTFVCLPLSKVKPHSIVYCGNISKYHLLDLLFVALKDLKEKYPDIQLNIIGSGPDELFYKNLAVKLDLEKNINFAGFIKDSNMFRETIAENSVGIALYNEDEDFIKYTEPAKVKTYLGYGVPVIVSRVPQIADEVMAEKVGFGIRNNIEELSHTIDGFFQNTALQNEYRNNIANYVRRFDINNLLDRTFSKTFHKWGLG